MRGDHEKISLHLVVLVFLFAPSSLQAANFQTTPVKTVVANNTMGQVLNEDFLINSALLHRLCWYGEKAKFPVYISQKSQRTEIVGKLLLRCRLLRRRSGYGSEPKRCHHHSHERTLPK
jgi:hypothetical protein